ncbi:hypothetical protein N9C32_00805 [Flavobacteriaceae bacterium]|nr:hypothetical protein [Flavobacteriaceae bacterium]MDA9817698.1 hypothetical protein [Flavobacteriaceae bacterium]MDA9850615.1 hypothetical protein [Flavobacteriaceae bacterium]MDB2366012.1 hypothetical protein [Flavobacteriaceae bacterium]MDC0879270.1 hypothetical protein [Flavobacteriaceae bacterium]|tara:strand:+ start:963 stop:1418 length:456 start_codon:yes stop_codon:yes gene_type:complete
MKNIILVLALIFISNIQSQENNRNDLIGEWEFKIDVKDVIKNSDDLNGFEKLAARAFSGIIEEALNKTQILIDFKKNNTAAIIITTGEKTESKVVFSWEIDQKGYLILDATYDQTEVQFGDTAYWVFDDDKLVPYDIKGNINKGMLLIKVI